MCVGGGGGGGNGIQGHGWFLSASVTCADAVMSSSVRFQFQTGVSASVLVWFSCAGNGALVNLCWRFSIRPVVGLDLIKLNNKQRLFVCVCVCVLFDCCLMLFFIWLGGGGGGGER